MSDDVSATPIPRPADDPEPVPAETRDWTFVLTSGCEECGWEQWPDVASLRSAWDRNVAVWPELVTEDGAAQRPDAQTWSALEYGAHVRDMVRLLRIRASMMLERHDPEFFNWDGDGANVVRRDWAANPQELAVDLRRAAEETGSFLDSLTKDQLERNGHRGDGAPFSVLTLWQYMGHDVEHHVWDVVGRRA
ncbi:MAG: DinB family protein [Galactobacter sp.]